MEHRENRECSERVSPRYRWGILEGVDKENVRAQTRATRIVGRLLIVLALVAGIAAMHTAVEMPMASAQVASAVGVDSVTMHSSMVAPATQPSPDGAQAGVTTAQTLIGLMSHDAMHACLFLVIATAFLLLLVPSVGETLPFSAPRPLRQRRQDFASRGIDRILVLRVLRI